MSCAYLQGVLQRRFRNCELSIFGSSAGGISNPNSDIDMSLYFPPMRDAETAYANR
jgi:predicted nucleotidyltransferase